jgi:hypothetical protein
VVHLSPLLSNETRSALVGQRGKLETLIPSSIDCSRALTMFGGAAGKGRSEERHQ